MITLENKLKAIERLIEAMRWSRAAPESEQATIREALKAMSQDYKARLPAAPGTTRALVGMEIARAVRGKVDYGYTLGHLRAVAEAAIGGWPVIEYALEMAEREPALDADLVQRFTAIVGTVIRTDDDNVKMMIVKLVAAAQQQKETA